MADADDYRRAADSTPSAWERPDAAVVEANAHALEAGWEIILALARRPASGETVLRFMVRSFDDAVALRAIGRIGGLRTTSFLYASVGRWRWRWPLRVGVLASPTAHESCRTMRGNNNFADQYEVRVVGPDERAELDVLVVDEADPVSAAAPGAVIVIGDDIDPTDVQAMDERAHRGAGLEPGAVITIPDRDLTWFEDLVRELSHDRPLDAAVGLARPDALTVGSPRLFGVTAIRNWAFAAAAVIERRVGLADITKRLRRIADEERFDSEQHGGRETRGAVVAAEGTGEPTIEVTSADRDADDRRLFARVTDPSGTVRTDGFVAGGVNTVAVCIATQVAGAVQASDPFRSPAPDQTIDLEVLFHIGGSRAKPQRRTLTLPASGPSTWTKPVRVSVPKSRA